MFYRIKLTPDTNNTFLATCYNIPEFTGVVTSVESLRDECLAGLLLAISIYMDADKEVPITPINVFHDTDACVLELPVEAASKIILHNACIAKGINRPCLAKLLNKRIKQINDLFDFDKSFNDKVYKSAQMVLRMVGYQ